jgi:uncharacterized protein YjbI with pentapeptide repeats
MISCPYCRFPRPYPGTQECGCGATIFPTLPEDAPSKPSAQNFKGASLSRHDFSGHDLRGADFSGASLSRCSFQEADLRGAKFDGASISRCDMRGAQTEGASFVGVAQSRNRK